jgi:hypothetical protein
VSPPGDGAEIACRTAVDRSGSGLAWTIGGPRYGPGRRVQRAPPGVVCWLEGRGGRPTDLPSTHKQVPRAAIGCLRPPLSKPCPPGPSALEYAEKVRSQFLSLRQPFRTSTFSLGGKATIRSIKLGLFKNQTVLESAELGDLLPGDGIFLQSFVLRQFSIV